MAHDTHRDAAHNSLPGWVNWVQDHLLLSCLILAEAYLLGTLMTLGWVSDIERPESWGIYSGIGVVLFFLAGATAAGIALRCSVTAAAAFGQRRWGTALFNFMGVMVFVLCEVWASLSERSTHLLPTPADTAVLSLLHLGSVPISPTIVIVALVLPFATLFYGFSQRPSAPEETAEERATRQQRELDEAEHKARLAGSKGKVMAAKAAARRKQVAALMGVAHDETIDGQEADATTSNSDGNDVDMHIDSTDISAGNTPTSGQAGSGGKGLHAVPSGRWIWRDLIADMQARYGITLTEREARDAMKTMLPPDKRERLEGVTGKPYCAHKATVRAWVDREATRRLRDGDSTRKSTQHASA